MADVLLIFVSENIGAAEALALACEEAGLSIYDGAPEDGASYRAALAVWSEAARASPSFHEAVRGPLAAGKALIANLTPTEAPEFMTGAPVFDLADGDSGGDAPVLAHLIAAMQRRVRFASLLSDMKTFAAEQTAPPEPELAIAEAAPLFQPADPNPEEAPQLLDQPLETPEPVIATRPEPIEPIAEMTPVTPAQRRRTSHQKTSRARSAPRNRIAQRPDHSLHDVSKAMLIGAAVFILIMAGGAMIGAIGPVRLAQSAPQLAESSALPLAPPVPAAALETPAVEEAEPASIQPALRRHARPAPALPSKLARMIAARELERAQWALAQEKLIKDRPQQHAEVRPAASSRALASAALSR